MFELVDAEKARFPEAASLRRVIQRIAEASAVEPRDLKRGDTAAFSFRTSPPTKSSL